MDILSNAARKNGGRTIGVLPEVFSHLANDDSTIIAAKDFAERKAYMMTHADAFFCLPGSFGTLDEMTDMLVGKLLTIHTKPVVLINTDGFYDDLLKQFAKAVQVGMAEPNDGLFAAVDTPQQALEYLRTYVPKKRTHKGIRG